MTACVNRKHTKKVAAVVTASLVGALSLGVAPVAAMAEDTGIDLQVANWKTGAIVTAATDGNGAVVTGDLMKKSFTQGSRKFLVPTEVTGTFATTEIEDSMLSYRGPSGLIGDLDDATSYFDNQAVPVGTYYVDITIDTVTLAVPFKIVGQGKVEGVTVKGTPTYNGKNQSATLSFVDAEGYEIANGTDNRITYTDSMGVNDAPLDAGSYVANFTVDGNAYSVSFSIAKLDLSKASVVVEDSTTPITSESDLRNAVIINGGTAGDFFNDIRVTKITDPSGAAGFDSAKGNYEATIAPTANNANVTGSATVSYCTLDNDVADHVAYGRTDVFEGGTLNIEFEYGDVFDASQIVVEDASGNSYSGDRLEITYTDADNGQEVDASALANAGTYDLSIRVKPTQDFATNAWSGGTINITVEVVPVTLNDGTDLAFFLDGELTGSSETVTYDGTDQLEKIDVVVKGADGQDLVEGTDYEVKVKDQSTNREVDSIVDAGVYEISVSPLTFTFSGSGDTLTLNVNPIQLGLSTDPDGELKDFIYLDRTVGGITEVLQNDAIAYTGSAVEVPTVMYPVLNDDSTVKKDKDGNVVYAELSPELYNIVSVKDENDKTVDEAVEVGEYTVRIALSDAAKSNYALDDKDFVFEIREAGHFSDVDSSKWYSVPVEQAYSQWYINGISGTNLFAPEADITRADAVCILFNMAGGDNAYGDFQYSEDTGWVTGFEDVDGHAYFAKALAWANAFGVANGYGDGTFHPYAQITREEFASMLANYAKAMGKFEAASDDALDGMSDVETVSDWATDNIAWAVENGVMGNGGFVAGQSNITRAEVAAMAVNYQPEMIRTDVQPR